MSADFRIIDVFRPRQRKGPILVGATTSASIAVGAHLMVGGDPSKVVRVIAVDFPTPTTADRLALVVHPDLGSMLAPGVELELCDSGDGATRPE